MIELPEWARDRLTSVVDIEFGWRDRFRILFGFKVELRVKNTCENIPGRVETETEIRVYRPRPPRLFLGVAMEEMRVEPAGTNLDKPIRRTQREP